MLSPGSRIPIGDIKAKLKVTPGKLGEEEAIVRLYVKYNRNIQLIALPFREVPLTSSYVKAMHRDNDSRDKFIDDNENIT